MKVGYFGIGRTVSATFDLTDLSRQDQVTIFHHLADEIGVIEALRLLLDVPQQNAAFGAIDLTCNRYIKAGNK